MKKDNSQPVFLEYFNQGSDSLISYKDIFTRYLSEKVGIDHYRLDSFTHVKLFAILCLPIHYLITNKRQIKLTWHIIKQLSPRRYRGNLSKEILALIVWEYRFLHFKLVVHIIRPDYFLCADSAFFLLRWIDYCKKRNITVIRDFNDYGYSFSILRSTNSELRTNYDFSIDLDEINLESLNAFREEFDIRLKGVSENPDYVLAHNSNNSYLTVHSTRLKVLLATHIFGDAPSAHVSIFQDFEEWVHFFLCYFADKTDDYLLIVKQHPSVSRYLEEGVLMKLLGDSGMADKVLYVPGNTQISYENVDIVITANGSIAHEYIYRKKPVFSTSNGFSHRYMGCYYAKSYSEIDAFFSDSRNIQLLRQEAELNHDYNLRLSYVFHKCPNLWNNEKFRIALENMDYDMFGDFFDEAGLIEFIFNTENENHYFILTPNLIS